MKRFVLSVLLGAALAAASAAGAAVVRLPDTAQGGTGAVVDVPITVNPGTGVLGIDMTITYDAAVLTAQNVVVSGPAAAQGFTLVRNLNNPGVVIISEYAMQNALVGAGETEIAKISFLVVGGSGATSALTFTNVSINENGIPATPDHGLFTVTCTTPVPVETANLQFTDDVTLTWNATASANSYDVLRGAAGQWPVGSGAGELCLESAIGATTKSDLATPPVGTGYWYLVRGRGTCGAGTYGFRGVNGAPGAERTSAACP
jgi:hypothetical protein